MAKEPQKVSIVMSGGSEKGYFQVGAFKAIIEAGFVPDRIYGTSVGSLNGAFITYAAAKIAKEKGHNLTTNDWHDIAMQLVDYWLENIKQPSDIAIQRSKFSDVWDILFNHFKGLSDTSPINSKIDNMLTGNLQMMAAGPVALKIASVDYLSGQIFYISPESPNFLTYIKGSIAIPILMPPSILPSQNGKEHQVLYDGGVRAVAPLGVAINDGATDIIAVICQAANLSADNAFQEGKILDLTERTLDIVVNQNVDNDVRFIDVLNSIITDAAQKGCILDSLKKYKLISHNIIRPEQPLKTDITSFNADDIRKGIEIGYETAKTVLKK